MIKFFITLSSNANSEYWKEGLREYEKANDEKMNTIQIVKLSQLRTLSYSTGLVVEFIAKLCKFQ